MKKKIIYRFIETLCAAVFFACFLYVGASMSACDCGAITIAGALARIFISAAVALVSGLTMAYFNTKE